MKPGVLYAVACGAPPSGDLATMVRLAQDAGWDVCVIATPSGSRWLDTAALAELTGHPVRSDYKLPGQPDVLPPPDAIVVAPATSNTVNKWAAGISDTLALGLVVEATGAGLPVVAMPSTSPGLSAYPVFQRSLAALREYGVIVLTSPTPPDDAHPTLPWRDALDALAALDQPAGP